MRRAHPTALCGAKECTCTPVPQYCQGRGSQILLSSLPMGRTMGPTPSSHFPHPSCNSSPTDNHWEGPGGEAMTWARGSLQTPSLSCKSHSKDWLALCKNREAEMQSSDSLEAARGAGRSSGLLQTILASVMAQPLPSCMI